MCLNKVLPIILNQKPPEDPKVYILKPVKLLITNYSSFIFPYSDPSFEGNHEHASASFLPMNRLRLCGHMSET